MTLKLNLTYLTLQLPSPQPMTPSSPPDYVVAVVGYENVGKSTVIRRAVKTWGGSPLTTSYTPDGYKSGFPHTVLS